MTVTQLIQEIYLGLLGSGWAMSEIDNLDLPRWMALRRWALQRKRNNDVREMLPVDEIRW